MKTVKDFPSLMRDKEDSIWLVNPQIEGRYYMVCLGVFNNSKRASGKGFGNMQSVSPIKLNRDFSHMGKGFFIEIEQTK